MGFRLTVSGGGKDIKFGEDALVDLRFLSESPHGQQSNQRREGLEVRSAKFIDMGSGNARATDFGMGVEIKGRINFSLGAELEDATVAMAEWSLMPSDRAEAYRKAVVQVVSAGQVVREYTLPNAFIVTYSEELDDESGVGEFVVQLRQKKDCNPKVELKGGFELS